MDLNNLKLEHGRVEFDGKDAYSKRLMRFSDPGEDSAAEGVCQQYFTNTA
jgi:hypothetical protein